MFLDAVEIEPQIQFSGLEREATRMVRSPKAEMLFHTTINALTNLFKLLYSQSILLIDQIKRYSSKNIQ